MTTPSPYGAPAPGAYPPPPPHGAPTASGYAASGYPEPAPQLPDTPAPLGRRASAYIIDLAIVVLGLVVWLVVGWLLAAALGTTVALIFAIAAWILAVAWWFAYTAMQGGHGSIGMRLMRLRLVRLDDGAPLGFGGALLRNVIWALAAGILVGYFSVLFDKTGRGQGWHDRVARAFMQDASSAASATGAPVAAAVAPLPVSPVSPAYGGAFAAGAPPAPSYAMPVAPPVAPPFTGHVPPRPPLPSQPAAPAQVPATPAQAPATPPVADGLIAFVPGITQDPPPSAPAASRARAAAPFPPDPGPVPPAPVPAPAPPTGPAEDDLDSDTVLVRPATAEPAEPGLEDTRVVVRARPVVLEWDDGTRHTVAERALFGRNPAATDGAETVVVRDETLSLSKTHFEIVVTAGDAFVVDHHSTNGVTVVRGGARIEAAPGERVALEDGDALEIGDRIATYRGRG
ncbi:RDD family protein [Microbacterium rhizophilus]|uniref:RDD family protein n=1 Tax=Microbacterium rhizophilus TaxID=3138934 RepID=UPI0031E51A0C